MTVEELIDELQKMPQDIQVADIDGNYINVVEKGGIYMTQVIRLLPSNHGYSQPDHDYDYGRNDQRKEMRIIICGTLFFE